MKPYEKLVADAEQRLLERKARAYDLIGLLASTTPDERELDVIERTLKNLDDCPVDHENAEDHEVEETTPGSHADVLCKTCGVGLRYNNNGHPTPFSEAP